MNRKRNVNYIKPEDPEFLKVIKRQAGYDDRIRNRKFDRLENAEEDFVDNTESEEPQVVVLKTGDLTAEEAEVERKRIEKEAEETKADLSQRVIFKSKAKKMLDDDVKEGVSQKKSASVKKQSQLLSFGDDDADDSDNS